MHGLYKEWNYHINQGKIVCVLFRYVPIFGHHFRILCQDGHSTHDFLNHQYYGLSFATLLFLATLHLDWGVCFFCFLVWKSPAIYIPRHIAHDWCSYKKRGHTKTRREKAIWWWRQSWSEAAASQVVPRISSNHQRPGERHEEICSQSFHNELTPRSLTLLSDFRLLASNNVR